MVTAAEQGQLTARLMDAAAELIAERGWGAVARHPHRRRGGRAGAGPGPLPLQSVTDLLMDSSLRAAQTEVARDTAARAHAGGPGRSG